MDKTIYIGLLTDEGTEPPKESGYARVAVEGFAPAEDLVIFPDAVGPGYGNVTHYGLFDRDKGGETVSLWPLPEPVNAHAGTVPLIWGGKMLLGVDVSARVLLQSMVSCRQR